MPSGDSGGRPLIDTQTIPKGISKGIRSPSFETVTESDTYRYFVLKKQTSKYPQPRKAGRQFKERASRLENVAQHDERDEQFRGIFSLFWTAMAFYGCTTLYEAYVTQGEVIKSSFLSWLTYDGWNLFLADMIMIAFSFVSVGIQKAVIHKLLHREPLGRYVQWVWEGAFFTTAVWWTIHRDWPLVQSSFFTMHAMTMTLKMHSYLSHNGDLAILQQCYDEMRQRQQYLETIALEREQNNGQEMEEDEVPLFDPGELKDIGKEMKKLAVCLHLSSPSRYPENVSMENFFDFLLIPTIVYQLEYPRTKSFRPFYFLGKLVSTIAVFMLMYVTAEKDIQPILHQKETLSPGLALSKLIFPMMITQLMVFFMIFECICNGFAELSRFGDRNFYDDWWNSSSFEEYARKWNKPIHEFLFRHVYVGSLYQFNFSKEQASVFTFFVSSILHELVLAIVMRQCRVYFFVVQMLQIPLIQLFRHPLIKNQKTAGNFFFWFSMFLGPPLLFIMYTYDSFFPFALPI